MDEINIKKHDHKSIAKGSIIAMIGKRGSGKSEAMKSICYHFKDSIPRFVVVSKSEQNNNFFKQFIPKNFVYYKWDPMILKRIFTLQDNLIKKYGSKDPRTHLMLILDDCLCDKQLWKQPEILELFQNGRHKNITFMFSMQYSKGIAPELRGNVDYVFVYYHETVNEKKKIYEEWIGGFETYKQFVAVFDAVAENYQCLVRKNKQTREISEKIFRYKAPINLPPFRTGHKVFWSDDNMPKKVVKKDNMIIRLD